VSGETGWSRGAVSNEVDWPAFQKGAFSMITPKAKPVDRAKPVIRRSRSTDTAKVAVTRTTVSVMQGSPAWANAPAIQTAATAWTTAADAVETNAKILADLRMKLVTVTAEQRGLRRDWNVATQHVLATVAMHTQGSADQIHAYGFDVLARAGSVTVETPADLVTSLGKATGEVAFRWARGSARHGFLVQHATDTANAATVSSAVPCTKAKYTLTGALPAQTVFFRVAAIDPASPTGHTPWSDWIAGTAR